MADKALRAKHPFENAREEGQRLGWIDGEGNTLIPLDKFSQLRNILCMPPETIAEVCYEANRALTKHLADVEVPPSWGETSVETKVSLIAGVKWRLAHAGASAGAQHEEWVRSKFADGWALGEKKDVEKKTHPALIPYEQLSSEVKTKDELFVAIVWALSESH